MSGMVTARVPAKVNVQLAVGGVRPNGFHDLANVFLAVGLYDEVSATRADGLRITVSGPYAEGVPVDDSNLAARAATTLAVRHGLPTPGVHLHIAKDIPVAGGMAGGSADAAGALLACAALWGIHASHGELLELASELGSDVPFALLGGAALGRGRGERLTPLPVGGTLRWVFATADGGLATPAVYRECDRLREASGTGAAVGVVPDPEPSDSLLDALSSGDAEALAAALAPAATDTAGAAGAGARTSAADGTAPGTPTAPAPGAARPANELQPAALSLYPSLADTLATGRAAGALAGLVSGSGPTCAFLAQDAESADTIAAALLASGTCRDARTAGAPAPGATLLD